MADCTEVLYVTDSSTTNTVTCYDPFIGTNLMIYKGGGNASRNTLSLVGGDYLITANSEKPLLHVWSLNNSEPISDLKMVVAGKATALTISPDGVYCIASVNEKIYIWQICSGVLLNVVAKHYQDVTKIIFLDDCTHFVSCGKDGLILVWRLADVIQHRTGLIYNENKLNNAPIFTFTQHSLPVTDIHVGRGNCRARLFSISDDQTCKIFSLLDGSLLLSIVFDYSLTSILVNVNETTLLVGTKCGKILKFGLDPYPRSLDFHTTENDFEKVLNGHTKAVTCLSASIDGYTIASGSEDEKVIVWDLKSGQMMKSFDMKGSVTNLQFRMASHNIFTQTFNPSLCISKFHRVTKSGDEFEVNIIVQKSLVPLSHNLRVEPLQSQTHQDGKEAEGLKQLQAEVERLKVINKQLYQFAMRKILNNPMVVPSIDVSVVTGN